MAILAAAPLLPMARMNETHVDLLRSQEIQNAVANKVLALVFFQTKGFAQNQRCSPVL